MRGGARKGVVEEVVVLEVVEVEEGEGEIGERNSMSMCLTRGSSFGGGRW